MTENDGLTLARLVLSPGVVDVTLIRITKSRSTIRARITVCRTLYTMSSYVTTK